MEFETAPTAQALPRPDATQTPTTAPDTKKATKQRDALFDNAKFVAIVLVALAHAWEPLMDGSRTARALYMFIYTFHMPAFILISGYFSRTFDMRPDRLRRLVTGVAVPYVIFETVYSLYEKWGNDDPGHEISLLDPYYLTWFLAALFIWRMTTPIWLNLRYPLTISVVIAVLASITPNIGDDLDLQRVLQFLPFFVLGLRLETRHFQLLRRHGARRSPWRSCWSLWCSATGPRPGCPSTGSIAARVSAAGRVLVGGRGHGTRAHCLFPGADRLLPDPGAAWQDLVHDTGRRHALRAICCTVCSSRPSIRRLDRRRRWVEALAARCSRHCSWRLRRLCSVRRRCAGDAVCHGAGDGVGLSAGSRWQGRGGASASS